MYFEKYIFDGSQKYEHGEIRTDDKEGIHEKKEGIKRLEKNREKISKLQEALYAEGKQSLLVIFQAMDAAGKDGTIRHIFTGVNPQGVQVTSFKQPSEEELAHDYLWRVHRAAPRRGMIGVFNRSHYEDVLVGKVLDLPKKQAYPDYALEDVWDHRYRQIRDFERHLHENGTTILKFYLHLSQEEQNKRFLERLADESKTWKFSEGDLATSENWDEYMHAYEKAINETAAGHAPWCVIPADRKWYMRALVSDIILETLRKMAPQYPELSNVQLEKMAGFRVELEALVGEEETREDS